MLFYSLLTKSPNFRSFCSIFWEKKFGRESGAGYLVQGLAMRDFDINVFMVTSTLEVNLIFSIFSILTSAK